MILALPVKSPQLQPFRYSVLPKALDAQVGDALLEWLERDAPWTLRIAEFYEQHEFTVTAEILPPELRETFSDAALQELRARVSDIFDSRLSERVDVTVHRLTKGQRIRIHNDFIPGRETHRLLIQLNRGWHDENGGALVLFSGYGENDVHRILRPLHNSGLLFEISSKSLHAVTPISAGERFTLGFSFFRSTS